jgi:hypothetical protein
MWKEALKVALIAAAVVWASNNVTAVRRIIG